MDVRHKILEVQNSYTVKFCWWKSDIECERYKIDNTFKCVFLYGGKFLIGEDIFGRRNPLIGGHFYTLRCLFIWGEIPYRGRNFGGKKK